MAAAAKAVPRVRNVVHDDAIWRQTIHYEESTAQNWDNNWGFMRDDLYDEERQNPRSSSAQYTTAAPQLPAITAKFAKGGASKNSISETNNSNGKINVGQSPDPRFRKFQPSPDRFLPNEPSLPTIPNDEEARNLLMMYDVPRVMKKLSPVQKYPYPRTTTMDVGWLWKNVKGYKHHRTADKGGEGMTSPTVQSAGSRAGIRENSDSVPHGGVDALAAAAAEGAPRNDAKHRKEKGKRERRQWQAGNGVEEAKGEVEKDEAEHQAASPSFVTLEIYGKHARGRQDVLKWWGGTRESMP